MRANGEKLLLMFFFLLLTVIFFFFFSHNRREALIHFHAAWRTQDVGLGALRRSPSWPRGAVVLGREGRQGIPLETPAAAAATRNQRGKKKSCWLREGKKRAREEERKMHSSLNAHRVF